MQTAELLVEIDEAGGHPDGFAAALERRLRIVDGIDECGVERRNPPSSLTRRGEIEQLSLGPLDLPVCRVVEIVTKGVVDDVLTKS